ncbi:antitoxin VapB family protein [Haloplanus pelagicus]|jgi:predicted CopG family antitoxin|uniref:antitoxin VapB family protein n=1 Tax=Haloplanus pelagicus TaxID=2949995 RepID=UPI00203DC8A6|nr:antitoxin VapB family protein [Haloplanus sp. HW8-1]
MSTSIRVSDDTKEMLESLKRDDETFDELLERLAQSEKPINVGAWSEEEADRAREAVKRSRESFER